MYQSIALSPHTSTATTPQTPSQPSPSSLLQRAQRLHLHAHPTRPLLHRPPRDLQRVLPQQLIMQPYPRRPLHLRHHPLPMRRHGRPDLRSCHRIEGSLAIEVGPPSDESEARDASLREQDAMCAVERFGKRAVVRVRLVAKGSDRLKDISTSHYSRLLATDAPAATILSHPLSAWTHPSSRPESYFGASLNMATVNRDHYI